MMLSELKNFARLLFSRRGGDLRWKILSIAMPMASLVFLSVLYGFYASAKGWFPTKLFLMASSGKDAIEERLGLTIPWYLKQVGDLPTVRDYQPGKMAPGLTLVSGIGSDNHPDAWVVDATGKVIHKWNTDWFRIWQNPEELPEKGRFNAHPGPITHGMIVTANGDLVFNFERAGLIRLDACGNVRWKLPVLTHHSIDVDDDGNLWVPADIWAPINDPKLPGYKGETEDYWIYKVSPQGKVLAKWRIADLLLKNGLDSYLYTGVITNFDVTMSGDVLHFNDLEVFPKSMKPGTFKPGDVMISLRNLNAIFVFDPKLEKVVYFAKGTFIRQHDPDFVDGDTIRMFDNQTNTLDTPVQSSRILEIHADGRPERVLFKGTRQFAFFSAVLGKIEPLTNGNILITGGIEGRALEIDAQGKPVWEFRNFVRPGMVGAVTGASRLPPAMDAAFFARARAACGGAQPSAQK